MRPADVRNSDTKKIKLKMYPKLHNVRGRYKFAVNDPVRLAKEKRSFEKSFEQGWTEEIFYIAGRLPRRPPVYKVKDSLETLLKVLSTHKSCRR